MNGLAVRTSATQLSDGKIAAPAVRRATPYHRYAEPGDENNKGGALAALVQLCRNKPT
jgi:hypothetical protein